nr:hypothetical protein [Propionibacterium freudenreichii]
MSATHGEDDGSLSELNQEADNNFACHDVGSGRRAGAQPVPCSPRMFAEEQGGDLLNGQERAQYGEPRHRLLGTAGVRISGQDQLCLRAGVQQRHEDERQEGHDY